MLPCLQNPTTHYDSGGSIISGNPLTWIDKGAIKSIYDPCPYGYRVPINGSWVGFTNKAWTNGDIKGGTVWQSTWWPAAGQRITNTATMNAIAGNGRCWSSSSNSSNAGYTVIFDYNGTVTPSLSNNRSNGFSLRCVQE